MEKSETPCFVSMVHRYNSVTSTNDIAKKLANKGAQEGTIVISKIQSKGRGRFCRDWISPNGGIYFSMILRPKISIDEAYKLTYLAAVAVVKSITKIINIDSLIKWPNDIMVKNKKIGGILTEIISKGGVMEFAVIGVGLNANIELELFPINLRRNITSIKEELGTNIDCKKLIQELIEEIENYYRLFIMTGFTNILREWKALSCTLGKKLKIVESGKEFEGTATNVDDSGALIIKLNDGVSKSIISKNVSIKRE